MGIRVETVCAVLIFFEKSLDSSGWGSTKYHILSYGTIRVLWDSTGKYTAELHSMSTHKYVVKIQVPKKTSDI